MSTTDISSATSTPTPNPGAGEWRLEVVGLPVTDVDRAKAFYVDTLGWRLDADFNVNPEFWVVQVTPPGSLCSIHFGKGITAARPAPSTISTWSWPTSRRRVPTWSTEASM